MYTVRCCACIQSARSAESVTIIRTPHSVPQLDFNNQIVLFKWGIVCVQIIDTRVNGGTESLGLSTDASIQCPRKGLPPRYTAIGASGLRAVCGLRRGNNDEVEVDSPDDTEPDIFGGRSLRSLRDLSRSVVFPDDEPLDEFS
jgi:hypothetical protein